MNIATIFLFAQTNEHSQMSAKAGMKKFGDRAIAVMFKERSSTRQARVRKY